MVEVELNLAAFLRAARKIGWEQPFWIDAICINQTDIPERNDQILRMRDIYRSATRGIIWLGPGFEDSGLALEFAELFSGHETNAVPALYQGVSDLECLLSTTRSGQYSQHWDALELLLERSWWKRIWTVQEIVLSKDPIVVCGSRFVGWFHLARLLDNIRSELFFVSQELKTQGMDAFSQSVALA
jgi:hypothetical protein